MNYPIYNCDYPYRCEDVLRYLQAFPQHIVYIAKPFQSRKKKEMYSTHVYPSDGLSIELRWKHSSIWISSKLSSMKKLLLMQEEGEITLLDFKILRYSADHVLSQKALLDPTARQLYYSTVLGSSGQKPYTEREYHWFEYALREPGEIADIFFQMLEVEVANALAFERYYEAYTKRKRTME